MKKVFYYLGLFFVLRILTLIAFRLQTNYIGVVSTTYNAMNIDYLLKNIGLLLIGIALGINHIVEQKCKLFSFKKINISKLIIIGMPYLMLLGAGYTLEYLTRMFSFISNDPTYLFYPFFYNPIDETVAPIILGLTIMSSIKKALFIKNKRIIIE